MPSELESIIEAYPSAPYDWLALSMNPNISFGFIQSHPELPWNMKAVSRNASVSEAIVRSNPSLLWSYPDLCSNPNMSFDFFKEFVLTGTNVIYLNWNALSQNRAIKLEDIDRYSHYPWVDLFVSMNPNINSNYILNEGRNRAWDFRCVSANPGIKERDIYKRLIPFEYPHLSINPNLPCKFVNDNMKHPWNWHSISGNPNTHIVDINSFGAIPWDYSGLSFNKNLSADFILSNQDRQWNKATLVSNPAFTWETIMTNDHFFMNDNLESLYCFNPNVSLSWIRMNERNVNWKRLSSNIFNLTA
jgi:hypothetical protein